MFFKKATSQIDWMIVGLGNPGKKYDGTRHNVGFAVLDAAAEEWGIKISKSKFDGLYGLGNVGGQKVLLLKPQTFMNLSGVSVQKAAAFYKVPPQRILVWFDDVSLAPGILRIRLSGSAGGHNGLKSIIASVGQEFPRVKIGVGEKPRPEYDLADWVLSRFTQAESKAIQARYADIASASVLLMQGKTAEAMSRYNGEGHDG
ncbi:aminoacyl-tRNA hydrolase [Ruminococcaceae bacterium OttesenSCG-928-A16]|nr:aminoacyl-tRNA hydrolase [Ruminococcaceae bacterium OttesenSCG-928-A16]